jgi:hypothetical protein
MFLSLKSNTSFGHQLLYSKQEAHTSLGGLFAPFRPILCLVATASLQDLSRSQITTFSEKIKLIRSYVFRPYICLLTLRLPTHRAPMPRVPHFACLHFEYLHIECPRFEHLRLGPRLSATHSAKSSTRAQ